VVNLCKDTKSDCRKLVGGAGVRWESMLIHINEYCKFANSWELGSWWQMLVRLGQSRINYQSTMEDWNLAIDEFHVARISQCLCLELFEISGFFTNVGRVS
jgi:hypothetical protein